MSITWLSNNISACGEQSNNMWGTLVNSYTMYDPYSNLNQPPNSKCWNDRWPKNKNSLRIMHANYMCFYPIVVILLFSYIVDTATVIERIYSSSYNWEHLFNPLGGTSKGRAVLQGLSEGSWETCTSNRIIFSWIHCLRSSLFLLFNQTIWFFSRYTKN